MGFFCLFGFCGRWGLLSAGSPAITAEAAATSPWQRRGGSEAGCARGSPAPLSGRLPAPFSFSLLRSAPPLLFPCPPSGEEAPAGPLRQPRAGRGCTSTGRVLGDERRDTPPFLAERSGTRKQKSKN